MQGRGRGSVPRPRRADPGPTTSLDTRDRVSFVAVGDNIPDDDIGAYADSCSGTIGDGSYDHRPIYEPVKPLIESADLAYVDEETTLGGDALGHGEHP